MYVEIISLDNKILKYFQIIINFKKVFIIDFLILIFDIKTILGKRENKFQSS